MEALATWILVWMTIIIIVGGIAFIYLYSKIYTIWKEVEKLKKRV